MVKLTQSVCVRDQTAAYIDNDHRGHIIMYIIAGLGNPEEKYRGTRHNIGFDVIDALAGRHDIKIAIKDNLSMTGKGYICGEKVILAEPMTYMNKSGDSIWRLADFYKIDVSEQLIIVSDDIALPVGKIRIRPEGSAGGHNGLKSIIGSLGRQDFIRVRVGVGDKPDGRDLADHVLGRFGEDERKIMSESIERTCDAIEMILTDGTERAMNSFN